MSTRVYFNNIKNEIIKELLLAEYSINIVVPWFTDLELFKTLQKKAQESVEIKLVILKDSINEKSGIVFNTLLEYSKCKIWYIESRSIKTDSLMHH